MKTESRAIVRHREAVQLRKPRRLTKGETELLKRTVAKGVTDDEFALFLWVCKKHKIDPLTRQIHCVRRFVQKHHTDEKGIWVSGFQMVIQIGIDGYRALAGRDHPDFGGCDEPEFEYDDGQKRIPILARIRLWKKGLEHPIVGVAYWDEYAPRDLTKAEAFMWNKMPRHMLAKCAEALALRKGYPELADIYTNEEMSQAADDYTPEGRQIIDAQPVTGTHEAARLVGEAKVKKLRDSCKTKPKAPETSPAQQEASVLQEEIWPKGSVASVREPGMEG